MIYELRGAKGGVGTTTIAAAMALGVSQSPLLVDLAGDLPMVLGISDPPGEGVTDWLCHDATTRPPLARLAVEVRPQGARLVHAGSAIRWDRGYFGLTTTLRDETTVIIDNGTGIAADFDSHIERVKVLVTRSNYLCVRRFVDLATFDWHPDVVVLIHEPGGVNEPQDVERALRLPMIVVDYDVAISRAVDCGLLASRTPPSLVGLHFKINRALAKANA